MWAQIKGASKYFVNEKGEIKSYSFYKKGIILKQNLGTNKCYNVSIFYDDGSVKSKLVHRLVAEAFIPNPNNLPQVNHKDENRANNSISNLEWCDGKYNSNYGTGHARQTMACSKPVVQKSLDGQNIAVYPSAAEAQRQTGIHNGNISRACRKGKWKAGGYLWEYV